MSEKIRFEMECVIERKEKETDEESGMIDTSKNPLDRIHNRE
jgi:hypothetical protein